MRKSTCVGLYTVSIFFLITLLIIPASASTAEPGLWYEAGEDEQVSYLFEYFQQYLNDNPYDSDQSYIDNDFLIQEWQKADSAGGISNAPEEAKDLAVAVFLRLKRNEIYARNKDTFNDDVLREYFSTMDWYEHDPGFTLEYLSETEVANVKEIVRLEKKLKDKDQAILYPYISVSAELSDGSTLKGNLLLKKFEVNTDYGVLGVPVETISSIEKSGSGDQVVILTRNGDRVTATPKRESLPVFTVLGWDELKLEAVKKISFKQSATSGDSRSLQPALSSQSDPDLIAHWPMNEGKGRRVIRDHSSNRNHAEINGLGWGKDGGLFFPGTIDKQ